MGKDVEVLERLGLSKEVIKRYKERTKELEKESKRESKIQFTESKIRPRDIPNYELPD